MSKSSNETRVFNFCLESRDKVCSFRLHGLELRIYLSLNELRLLSLCHSF